MLLKKDLLLVACFWFLTLPLYTQDSTCSKNCFFIEAVGNVGKIVKNYPRFPVNDYCLLNELNFGWQTQGTKSWHHFYGFPQFGVSLIYSYQGNDNVLGRTYSVLPNFSIHMLRYKKNDIELRIGSGFSYSTKIYDAAKNPTNVLIGSGVSIAPSFSMNYRRILSKELQLKFGVSTFHFSNGHFQLPNVGMNSVTFSAGLKYFPKKINEKPKKNRTAWQKTPVLMNARAGLGMHEFGNELGPVGGRKYYIYTGALFLSKRVGNISNIRVGITDKYYTNYFEYIKRWDLFRGKKNLNSHVFSCTLGYELICGHISLLGEVGENFFNPFYIYYHKREKEDYFKYAETWFCSRLGFQYYIWNPAPTRRFNIYTGLYINANFGRADFNEVSLGVSF